MGFLLRIRLLTCEKRRIVQCLTYILCLQIWVLRQNFLRSHPVGNHIDDMGYRNSDTTYAGPPGHYGCFRSLAIQRHSSIPVTEAESHAKAMMRVSVACCEQDRGNVS